MPQELPRPQSGMTLLRGEALPPAGRPTGRLILPASALVILTVLLWVLLR